MTTATDQTTCSPEPDAATVRHTPLRVTMAELPGLAGTDLGTSPGREVDQARIMAFAEATDDHQWLHTDPERAGKGPFGGTIAHGFLTLALGTAMFWDVLEVTDATGVLNYGLDRVRFVSPVPSGSHLVMTVHLREVEPVRGGLALHMTWTYQIPGAPRPACVAESTFRYYGE